MKNVVGGYNVTKGTCSVYIPCTIGNAPSLGNYDSQALPANDFWFFVKFGGKFFSAHLAHSVSAYIFL
jgi:hypothetical protein